MVAGDDQRFLGRIPDFAHALSYNANEIARLDHLCYTLWYLF